jgi:hypothetical protein
LFSFLLLDKCFSLISGVTYVFSYSFLRCKSFSLLLWIWLATWLVTCTYVVTQLCYSFPVGSPTFRGKKTESWTTKLVLTLFTATLIFEVESSSKVGNYWYIKKNDIKTQKTGVWRTTTVQYWLYCTYLQLTPSVRIT